MRPLALALSLVAAAAWEYPSPRPARPGAGDPVQCIGGPCAPGNDYCGEPFTNAPGFHLVDQHGCGENDPNGPVFDPVHGVIHHFYQIHLYYGDDGRGPDYGHFVSKDFIHWADVRTAIWNGLDASTTPWTATPYDTVAIYTGSAVVVDGAGPDGKPGVIQIYPGLCDGGEWEDCKTGTGLAQAVPADYRSDPLLVNWTKPGYNPIVNNTQRDPSTPWKNPATGEWRLRTFDSMVYGSASDEDMIQGKWYEIGESPDFRECECPSFYPLPGPSSGFEEAYESHRTSGGLPTHVHKTSCGGDFWQIGSYYPAEPKQLGRFNATEGWEDLFDQKHMDAGPFYASKDGVYPVKGSSEVRRINWGWLVLPTSPNTQSMPREITFNAAARTLQQAPIEEMKELRGDPAVSKSLSLNVSGLTDLGVGPGVIKQSETLAYFDLPDRPARFGLTLGNLSDSGPTVVGNAMKGVDLPGGDYNITHHGADFGAKGCSAMCAADGDDCKAWTWVIRGKPRGSGDCCLKNSIPCPVPAEGIEIVSGAMEETTLYNCGSSMECTVDYPGPDKSAPFVNASVACGEQIDTLRLLPSESTVELRLFTDWSFVEAYFQNGRVAMTAPKLLGDDSYGCGVHASTSLTANVTVFPMNSIWVDEDFVRKAPRIYN